MQFFPRGGLRTHLLISHHARLYTIFQLWQRKTFYRVGEENRYTHTGSTNRMCAKPRGEKKKRYHAKRCDYIHVYMLLLSCRSAL